MTRWIAPLQKLLPKNRVSTDPAILSAHAGDAWFASHRPEAVVFPRSAREVSLVLRFAHRRRIPVTARGAGRGYVGGCVPSKGGIVVSLIRMNRIREIHPGDCVAVVEPGVITAEVQAAAKAQGLFYPPDPASLKESSIGGNIATNAGGPRCLKYGVTRHYILGLEVVLMDGTVVRVGGRTHKNKTGFDLVGLFVGSEGMLGIVTEATLRLIPHPPARAAVIATFARARDAARAVAAVREHGLLPAALEIADPLTLRAARAHTSSVPDGNAFVLAELDGQKLSVRHEAALTASLFRSCGALTVRRAEGEAGCEKLWDMRRAFSMSLKATGLMKLNEDVTVPRSRLLDLFALSARIQRRYGLPVASFGHAGDGNIHVNIMVPAHLLRDTKRQNRALDELFHHVITWGGAITGEHGVGLAKKRWWNRATSPELRRLHQRIKSALDPDHLLNPGKFLGS
jgi:glycolate oxidase